MRGNGDSVLDLDLLASPWSFWFCPWSCWFVTANLKRSFTRKEKPKKRKRKKKRKKLKQKQTKLFLRPQKRPHWRSKKLSISTSWHIFEIFGSFQALQHWQQPDAACTGALKNNYKISLEKIKSRLLDDSGYGPWVIPPCSLLMVSWVIREFRVKKLNLKIWH